MVMIGKLKQEGLIIAMLVSLSIYSCSNNKATTVGTWNLVRLDTIPQDGSWSVSFRADSTFLLNENAVQGRWALQGSSLKTEIFYNNGFSEVKSTKINISNDTMYLEEDFYRRRMEKFEASSIYVRDNSFF